MYNARMPEWIGQVIGKVRIEKYLARGGMAEVYLGTHLTLERPVAVKFLHNHIESEPDLLTRFQREAKVVAGLRHPNIVQVFDFDTHEGHPYIVMEYINGLSFSSYLRKLHENNQELSLKQIAHLLKSLASALDYAHSQGVVHRDIKPANILLHSSHGDFVADRPITEKTEPVITDFGLVRVAHSGAQTASGMVSGTPKYMSPEQARGDKVDHRSDIYSLGVILYELLSGHVPFDAESTMTVMFKHINEPPPAIEKLAPQLQDVVDKALAKEADDRFQSAGEMAKAFYLAIGMNAEAETITTPPLQTINMDTAPKKKAPARGPILIGTVIFACVCLVIVGLGAMRISLGSFFPKLNNTTQSTPNQELPVTNDASPTPASEESPPTTEEMSVGILRFQNNTALMDKVTISASLDLPPENKQYEAWLIDDDGESSRSIGILERSGQGQYTLTYVDAQGQNLLGQYNRMEITLEPNPDDNPNSSRDVVYSGYLPSASLEHIRHLNYSAPETPNEVAVGVGLVNNVTLVKQATEAMVAAYDDGDPAAAQANAEIIVNLIVGKEDPTYYNDWNGDGIVSDPSDGFGLLINGDQAGYLDDMIHHSSYAADAKGSTAEIKLHYGHVEICIQNLETWAPELRDLALNIVRATDNQNIESDVRTALTLATQMLDGVDINGNETIDPIEGEGGAETAFEHAQYMSDIPILPGKNRE